MYLQKFLIGCGGRAQGLKDCCCMQSSVLICLLFLLSRDFFKKCFIIYLKNRLVILRSFKIEGRQLLSQIEGTRYGALTDNLEQNLNSVEQWKHTKGAQVAKPRLGALKADAQNFPPGRGKQKPGLLRSGLAFHPLQWTRVGPLLWGGEFISWWPRRTSSRAERRGL